MSWRTVSRIAAASAIAILMLTCLPVADSCAHEAKEASNAVYFATSSPLSSDDIDRLYDDRTGFAEFAMGTGIRDRQTGKHEDRHGRCCGDAIDCAPGHTG